jgi:hypothetical protein
MIVIHPTPCTSLHPFTSVQIIQNPGLHLLCPAPIVLVQMTARLEEGAGCGSMDGMLW